MNFNAYIVAHRFRWHKECSAPVWCVYQHIAFVVHSLIENRHTVSVQLVVHENTLEIPAVACNTNTWTVALVIYWDATETEL